MVSPIGAPLAMKPEKPFASTSGSSSRAAGSPAASMVSSPAFQNDFPASDPNGRSASQRPQATATRGWAATRPRSARPHPHILYRTGGEAVEERAAISGRRVVHRPQENCLVDLPLPALRPFRSLTYLAATGPSSTSPRLVIALASTRFGRAAQAARSKSKQRESTTRSPRLRALRRASATSRSCAPSVNAAKSRLFSLSKAPLPSVRHTSSSAV